MNNILTVKDLSICFRQYGKGLGQTDLAVISGLDLSIGAGEMVAVIGASGSGKSLLAHGILGILPYNAAMGGEVYYCGEPLTQRRAEKLRGREIVLVPQSVSYLDPLMKVGGQLNKGDKSLDTSISDILARYRLDESVRGKYPFELSGGMARRVIISTAVMEQPKLVIADEPTPGLHEDVARMVLSHFREMADEGAAVLLITHDLELALEVADRIVVFYAGCTIEEAAVADFRREDTLRHPYTRALWRAMPRNGFQPTAGIQPYAADKPDGCPYSPRCHMADSSCGADVPYVEFDGGHVRCVHSGLHMAGAMNGSAAESGDGYADADAGAMNGGDAMNASAREVL